MATIIAITTITTNADPNFFTILNFFSSQFTTGTAIDAMHHPTTNGIKNKTAFIPININATVANILNNKLTATCQYGRFFSIQIRHLVFIICYYLPLVAFVPLVFINLSYSSVSSSAPRYSVSTSSQISSRPCFVTEENGIIFVPGTKFNPVFTIFTCF